MSSGMVIWWTEYGRTVDGGSFTVAEIPNLTKLRSSQKCLRIDKRTKKNAQEIPEKSN